jgi:hypothetical protein
VSELSRRVLHEEYARAPEPVGVPAPDVIECGEVVLLPLADRAVVDVHEGVVARVGRLVGEFADDQIHLVRREHDAVDEIDRARAPIGKVLEKGLGIAMADMRERDIFLGREGPRLHAQGVAESAVGVGETEEQIAMLVRRRADHDVAIGQQHLQLLDCVVNQAVLERRSLDAEAGDGATDRDRLQLRDGARQQALGQHRHRQRAVAGHALDVDDPGGAVDVEHAVEGADIDLARRLGRAVAE